MNPKTHYTIALAGNPNVGKSTIFNGLTHLKQHTGNWSGVTVACATGFFSYRDASCLVVDLPGIYSLRTHSEEEDISKEYICSGNADLLLVVCDATCLERGLHLLKQIVDLKPAVKSPTILCVNLCDEAKKKGIVLDFALLSKQLNIPVVPCTGRTKRGLKPLKEQIYQMYQAWNKDDIQVETECFPSLFDSSCMLCPCCREEEFDSFIVPCLRCPRDFSPKLLAAQAVTYTNPSYRTRQDRLDRLLTGRFFGSLIMIFLLLGIFWLTIVGANVPSSFLWDHFYRLESRLAKYLTDAGSPSWFIQCTVFGVYRVVAWVVSVMLPPMAIFFPLFTLLEDLGYLPRVAFNMDCAFKKCKACGKQCLTMCLVMGPY